MRSVRSVLTFFIFNYLNNILLHTANKPHWRISAVLWYCFWNSLPRNYATITAWGNWLVHDWRFDSLCFRRLATRSGYFLDKVHNDANSGSTTVVLGRQPKDVSFLGQVFLQSVVSTCCLSATVLHTFFDFVFNTYLWHCTSVTCSHFSRIRT